MAKWPETYDVTDYFADGHTLHDFHGLIGSSCICDPRDFGGLPEYDPDTFMEERTRCRDEEILLENGPLASLAQAM